MSANFDVHADQIAIIGRATTRDEQGRWTPEWTREVLASTLAPAEDLTVQVKLALNGCWHRKAIGGKQTACGRPLGGWASRDESYAGLLCEEGCFSPYEMHELARLAASKDDDYVPDGHDTLKR
jgi:hypothetical protein